MSTVQVTPKVGSYVNEWVAVQFKFEEGVLPVKNVLRGTRWAIHEASIVGEDSYIIFIAGTNSWRVNDRDWVIKSPHDKVWFMGTEEFLGQFLPWSEV